jgi:hypothetical protein
MLDEPALVQIEPGRPEAALRVPTRDPHELVFDTEGFGEHRYTASDLRWDRPKDQLSEHHEVDHTTTEVVRATGDPLRQHVDLDRIQGVGVERDVEQRPEDGAEQTGLHRLESTLRPDRGHDTTGDEYRFNEGYSIDDCPLLVHADFPSFARPDVAS